MIEGSARGGFSIQFGIDVTKEFCRRCAPRAIRAQLRNSAHFGALPDAALHPPARSTGVVGDSFAPAAKKMRGFEITHNSMLLTIFSASNYGGVCRNRGGVLIFDEKAPR